MIIVPVEKQIDWRRPPLVLFALVILNVFIFAFYQSGDYELLEEAVQQYQQQGLLQTEWRAYQAYQRSLEQQGSEQQEPLRKNDEFIQFYIVSDPGFDRFMSSQGEQYIPSGQRLKWRQARQQVEALSGRVSSNAFGFHSNNVSPIQLISYQFLHGDISHLLGNMVFLILVGFAAEAALGSLVFLSFYLLSGIGAALLYAVFSTSSIGLVGASGSISGVMAMYVVLFGLRKIQFFYYVFVFTGYFRAAAIVILPFYILKELYSYFAYTDSNVAFTAHIGGFITGAVLVVLTQRYRNTLIDTDYLDNKPEPVDQTRLALQRVYDAMAQCEFAKAWELLKPIKAANANRPDVIEVEFNLVRAHHPTKVKEYILHRVDKDGNPEILNSAQIRFWKSLSDDERHKITDNKLAGFIETALRLDHLDVAQQSFKVLRQNTQDTMNIASLSHRLAAYCRQNNRDAEALKYNDLAEKMSQLTDVTASEAS